MRYELKAIREGGSVVSFDCQALDERDAIQQAEGQGLTVLTVNARRGLQWTLRRRDAFPLVLFSQELVVLLDAGLPLVESLATLSEKERKPQVKSTIARIAAIVREGQSLSGAMQHMPEVFPPLYVATIRASERTSDLSRALSRYVGYQTQLDAVRKKLANALIYPMLLVGAGGLVSLFLLVYVVPRFSHIYAERALDLPFFSQLLLSWGSLVEGRGVAALAIGAAAACAAFYFFSLEPVKARIKTWLWRSPAIGERIRIYQLARFYRTLGMLIRGGTPVVTAIDMSTGLLDVALRASVAQARRAISEGRPISDAMEAFGLTTPVALRMLSVGEQSGNMGEMLERIAGFHEEEIARWVDWFSRLFEPLLMAFIGLAIGAIVILMYMPIFELAGNIR